MAEFPKGPAFPFYVLLTALKFPVVALTWIITYLINKHHMVSLYGCRLLHSEMLQFTRYWSQQNIDNQLVLNLEKVALPWIHNRCYHAKQGSSLLVFFFIRFVIQFNKYLLRTTGIEALDLGAAEETGWSEKVFP